jgi:hypothetical protein
MFFFIVKTINEEGNRYGKLSVVEAEESRRGTQWLCVCLCGRNHIAGGVDLRAGRVTQCTHCSKVQKGMGMGGVAPCERDCPSVMSCKALAMACEPFETWVVTGRRTVADPMRFPPTKARFKRVMGSDQ